MIKQMDTSGDGKVDFDEFQQLFKTSSSGGTLA